MADTQELRNGRRRPKLDYRERSLLDQIVEEGRFGASQPPKSAASNLVKEFIAQFIDGSMTIARDAELMINSRIAQIDHLVSSS